MKKKCLSLLILCLFYQLANASTTFCVDGIYYLYGIDNTATVTFDMYGSSKYKGNIVIPEKITHWIWEWNFCHRNNKEECYLILLAVEKLISVDLSAVENHILTLLSAVVGIFFVDLLAVNK